MKMWSMIGATAIVIGIVVAWWLWPKREDPRLAEIRQLQAQLREKMAALANAAASESEDAAKASREERSKMFRELHDKMEALPEAEQQAIWKERQAQRDKAEQDQLSAFFAMSPSERQAYLDKAIQQQEERAARRKEWADAHPDAQNRRPFGTRGANRTDAQRMSRNRDQVNATTPEFRAQRTEFSNELNQRRQQLGLNPVKARIFSGIRGGGSFTPPAPAAPASTVSAPVPST